MSSSHGPTPSGPAALPSHPDARIDGTETPFSRFLRVDVVRFRHRLFSGEWSPERVYDVLRRGDAVALMPSDPAHDSVVLCELIPQHQPYHRHPIMHHQN